MPIFEQRCQECELVFELLVLTSSPYIIECPRCQSRETERLVSVCAPVVMKSPTYGSYRGSCANAFENFTLQNVHDKKTGKKVKVNSLAELRAAEREHHFSLDIASEDRADANEAPQNKEWAGDLAVASGYEWKWATDPANRAKSMASPIVQVNQGIASSAEEMLSGKVA